MSTNDAPIVNCIKCGEEVAITQVRRHQINCSIAEEQPVITCDGTKGNIHLLQHPCASNQPPKQVLKFVLCYTLY